jgi:hypothetical protein
MTQINRVIALPLVLIALGEGIHQNPAVEHHAQMVLNHSLTNVMPTVVNLYERIVREGVSRDLVIDIVCQTVFPMLFPIPTVGNFVGSMAGKGLKYLFKA